MNYSIECGKEENNPKSQANRNLRGSLVKDSLSFIGMMLIYLVSARVISLIYWFICDYENIAVNLISDTLLSLSNSIL